MGNLQEESDLKSTITISARRFEESPFIERTNTPNMIRGVYAGRYFPMQIDEDPIEKYWLLRQKAVIFDVPEKPIEISGPCLLYTSPSPRDATLSRMPSSA